ncbi:MAG: hypothetical protein GWO16_08345 [Gammaproteobacteria bacterium]|nr:hypothetical protein [Gammaproteobacteria bacterium]NIR97957.1 hypothetical protein [Gammaproteobacteria bacterium]NIT63658.1 hypothetical protein [Gammaproteobacteria bacterium]NIV21516.1 hypothetical protein [Gammaproteobacteria bacterium]NIY32238.1 hypothetical protein [Gammaproteobacteria bacterium]
MEIIYFALSCYALVVLTWLFYIAVMHLRRVRHELHPVARAHAYVLLAVGLALDLALNVVVGTILFLEPPHDPLFTGRLQRWKGRAGRRGAIARWICEHLLEQFDPGHCGEYDSHNRIRDRTIRG